jgi:2'-5' RNA ligase
MPDSTRTFVALEVPTALGEKLRKLQERLTLDVTGVRWTTPSEPFHLTLAFLGEIPHADLHAVCRAVAEAAAGCPPLALRLEGLGAFPDPARPRVLWVGTTGPGLEPLHRLNKSVCQATAALGYPADTRFHPHVTLGRLKPRRGPSQDPAPSSNTSRPGPPGRFPPPRSSPSPRPSPPTDPPTPPSTEPPSARGNPKPRLDLGRIRAVY